MEKKRRLLSGLIAALVAITLVSCCVVGVTFARYTSSYSGSATVGVAKWSIDVAGPSSGSTDVVFDDLSPLNLEYSSGYRKHPTEPTLVATITNNSDVAATVTVEAVEAEDFFLTEGGTAFDFSGKAYTEEQLGGIFSIAFFTDADGRNSLTSSTLNPGGSLTVYAVVTWTSDDESVNGEAAYERDTWRGENISKIAYTITYKAVQASETATD